MSHSQSKNVNSIPSRELAAQEQPDPFLRRLGVQLVDKEYEVVGRVDELGCIRDIRDPELVIGQLGGIFSRAVRVRRPVQ